MGDWAVNSPPIGDSVVSPSPTYDLPVYAESLTSEPLPIGNVDSLGSIVVTGEYNTNASVGTFV